MLMVDADGDILNKYLVLVVYRYGTPLNIADLSFIDALGSIDIFTDDDPSMSSFHLLLVSLASFAFRTTCSVFMVAIHNYALQYLTLMSLHPILSSMFYMYSY